MNFTREPIIETVITPKEGYKLVVRNSKAGGQEEFFVDAVEVITFGSASFFRSLEKPKCFLVPVGDYEILEVRESRMVLKTSGLERGIKIAGGREAPLKVAKEENPITEAEPVIVASEQQRADTKRRERRRYRKRRGKGESEGEIQENQDDSMFEGAEKTEIEGPMEKRVEKPSLIPPPSTLISETIKHYKTAIAEEKANQEEKKIFAPLHPPPLHLVKGIEQTEKDEEIPF